VKIARRVVQKTDGQQACVSLYLYQHANQVTNSPQNATKFIFFQFPHLAKLSYGC